MIDYKELLCKNEPQNITDFINDDNEKLPHLMFSVESFMEKWTKYKKETLSDISHSYLDANNNYVKRSYGELLIVALDDYEYELTRIENLEDYKNRLLEELKFAKKQHEIVLSETSNNLSMQVDLIKEQNQKIEDLKQKNQSFQNKSVNQNRSIKVIFKDELIRTSKFNLDLIKNLAVEF